MSSPHLCPIPSSKIPRIKSTPPPNLSPRAATPSSKLAGDLAPPLAGGHPVLANLRFWVSSSATPLADLWCRCAPYYAEGCPGCAVDRWKAANSSIPYNSFIYVWVVVLCTADLSKCQLVKLEIKYMVKEWMKYTGDDFLKALCEDMKDKYNKYWDKPNKVLLVASLLDPRYKLVLLKFGYTESYGEVVAEQRVDEVRKWFKEYYEYYEHMMETSSQRTTINSSPEVGGSANLLPMLTGKRKLELGFALFKQRDRPNRSRRSEVDIYLEDPLVPPREGESFDVLKWWKRNSEQYPILAKMVRDLLAIP